MVLLFIDGVGIGARDETVNPLAARPFLLSQFQDGTGEPLPDGGRLLRLDPRFAVSGRPQSASNQTAILTGEPAPQKIGKHLVGFPNAPLRALLEEHSIVRRLVEQGRRVTFANGYPAGYLDILGLRRRAGGTMGFHIPERIKRRLKPSASTLAMAAGNVELRTLEDVAEGHALTHDIDARAGRARGLPLPAYSAEQAAEILWSIAGEQHFTLFEHFVADEAGHAQDREEALIALETFDAFARAVVRLRPPGAQILICSDHGNVEDLSTRNHTLNDVPLLWFGPEVSVLTSLETVADVGRLILELARRD